MKPLSNTSLWGRLLALPKNMTTLSILARDQHSSLLRKSVNYGQKRFLTSAAVANFIKLYFVRNLRIFVIS
jgi:hypothetical protein